MVPAHSLLTETFEEYLQQQLIRENPQKLYDPINYIMQLGGKRIRPLAVLIAYQAFKADFRSALPLAYAFELFHNFTLAHDDVMDQAEMRRGKPAMHMAYNLNSAILSGDTMLILAYRYLLDASADPVVQSGLLRIFTTTAQEICAGQQLDMDFESRNDVTLPEYLTMIRWKTAVLLAACLQSGALLGGASGEQAERLYHFGLNIGLAFQIQDDVLDLYGDAAGFGKKTGGDILQKKKTYLFLKAIELSDEHTQQKILDAYLNDSLPDEVRIRTVRDLFDSLDVRNQAMASMQALTKEAMDHLDALQIGHQPKDSLRFLADNLLSRTS